MAGVDELTQAALMVTMAKGAAARAAQDGLGRSLDDLDKRVTNGILDKLDRGVMVTGQDALQAWMQLLANRRLRKELDRGEREGVVAAIQLTPSMNGSKSQKSH